jgi:hypothetical protein
VCVWLLRDRLVLTTPRVRRGDASASTVPVPRAVTDDHAAADDDDDDDDIDNIDETLVRAAGDDDLLSDKNVVYVLKAVLFLNQVRARGGVVVCARDMLVCVTSDTTC